MLTYLILLLLVFLGVILGLFTGCFAREELRDSRKYLVIFRHALYLVILLIFFASNPSLLFVLIVAGIIIAFSFSKFWQTLYYYALGIVFFLSWHYNGFTLIAPLIFLYGFPVGSLFLLNTKHFKSAKNLAGFDRMKKNDKKKVLVNASLGVLKQYSGFFITGLILGIIGLFI